MMMVMMMMTIIIIIIIIIIITENPGLQFMHFFFTLFSIPPSTYCFLTYHSI